MDFFVITMTKDGDRMQYVYQSSLFCSVAKYKSGEIYSSNYFPYFCFYNLKKIHT